MGQQQVQEVHGRPVAVLRPARKSLKRDGWFSRSWLKRNCGSSGLPSLAALSSAAVWSTKEAGSTAASYGETISLKTRAESPRTARSPARSRLPAVERQRLGGQSWLMVSYTFRS